MVDATAGAFGVQTRASTTSAKVSATIKKTPWFTVLVGLSLTAGLFALKVTALGLKEGWEFYGDLLSLQTESWRWADVEWHVTQWADVGIYVLEAAVAGAAGSVVFNYAVNNVSQTISNIWQQVDLSGSTDPTIMRVEPETRLWLNALSHESAVRAAEAMREQERRIDDLLAQISALQAQNAGLGSDMQARNTRLSEAFATIIEQIRLLREDLGRSQ